MNLALLAVSLGACNRIRLESRSACLALLLWRDLLAVYQKWARDGERASQRMRARKDLPLLDRKFRANLGDMASRACRLRAEFRLEVEWLTFNRLALGRKCCCSLVNSALGINRLPPSPHSLNRVSRDTVAVSPMPARLDHA